MSKATPITKLSLLALTLIAFALRVYRLDGQSYWIDEAWTLFYADQSLGELWYYLQTIRAAPPLYHVLTIYWIDLVSNGEYALRFLSVVTSVLVIPLTYRLGRTLVGNRLGLIAALLMTVAPYQIWHAQDARNYSMLTAASIMSLWSFFNLWRSGGWRWWLLYVLSTMWAIFTHYHGLVIIGVQGLYFLLTWRRHWRFYLPWAGTLLIILTPLAIWLTLGSTLWQSDHWLPFVGLWDSYVRSATAFSVGELMPRPQAIYLTLAFVIFYGLGLFYAARQFGWWLLAFLLAFTLAPNIATWLYSQIGTPVYLERYLIAVQVGYLLTVALGILALANTIQQKLTKWQGHKVANKPPSLTTSKLHPQPPISNLKSLVPSLQSPVSNLQPPISNPQSQLSIINYQLSIILTIPLLIISLFTLNHHYTDPVYAKPDWRGVVEMIDTFSQPGDAILMTGDGGEKLFDFYYQGELSVYYDFNTPVPPTDEARQRIAEIAAQHQRLWYTPYGVEIDATLESWLAENSHPAWQSWLGRKRLALYSLENPTVSQAINASFVDESGQGLILKSATLLDQPIAAGDLFPLTLLWQTDTPLTQNHQLSLRLINNYGDTFIQSDWPPLATTQPTTTWPVKQPITDQRSLWIPADTPPGNYYLQFVVYDPVSGQPLGQPHTIEGITITPAEIIVPPSALSIPNFDARDLGNITLLGYAAPEQIQPGQEMWLWLYWQANQPLNPESAIQLKLTAGDGQAAINFPLVADADDALAWQPGQVRRVVYHLPTSPRLAGETAKLSVANLTPTDESAVEIELTQINLESRPRQFDLPDIDTPLLADFGKPPQIKLLGTSISPGNLTENATQNDKSAISITLYWQAEQEMEINYTVFLQLLDQTGQVVAQIDQQPLTGAAPTTTWLPSEILTDSYTLTLPPNLDAGDYRLIAGFYDAASGERLPINSGDDFVELTQLPVQ